MATLSDVIPAGKTTGPRAIRWTPGNSPSCGCDGTLEIHCRRQVRTYAVREFVPDSGWDGRAFRLAKPDGSDVYSVFLARNSQDHTCDCAAGTYGRVTECCHVLALRAVLANGWLERDWVNPDADVSSTEPPF